MKIRPTDVRFTTTSQSQPTQAQAPANSSFSTLVRNANMETPPASAKPTPQDFKKAQEAVHDIRKDLAELQRLLEQRDELAAEKKDLQKRLVELKSAQMELQEAIHRQAAEDSGLLNRIGDAIGLGSDDRANMNRALNEISKQVHDTMTRLKEIDQLGTHNGEQTRARIDEISDGLTKAKQLAGQDPTTARFLDAVQSAFDRRSLTAAASRAEDAEKHLADQYRKALNESPVRVRPNDQYMTP